MECKEFGSTILFQMSCIHLCDLSKKRRWHFLAKKIPSHWWKRKWVKALLQYKQQYEALGSQVKALTKEKKEKENVSTYLELVNLNNASLLNFEKLKRNTTKAEKEKLVEENKEY